MSFDETAAHDAAAEAREAIVTGRTALGIELGSTRIKACLVDADDPSAVLAVGAHEWENEFVHGTWTYSLGSVWHGLRAAYAELVANVECHHGVRPTAFGVIGVSAMMHGYLAFDAAGELLVPFRTWRNTTTGPAASELSALFGVNIPLRWSIAHLHQAVLDAEPHLRRLDFITTLAGYVHWQLTGRRVLGVGDASGMFPIDTTTGDYEADLVSRYERLVVGRIPGVGASLVALLPQVLSAGQLAGSLSVEGAALLDPTGELQSGIPLCPPEGDAGTGMVATGSVAPRTGNVSAGTSIFAMVVLERPLRRAHDELDIVTTPAGDAVAMVHCNNGASELGAWTGLFVRFAQAAGMALDEDAVYGVLLREALQGDPDAGGLLAYNHLAGEPLAGLDEGRPLVVRTPDSRFTLASFMRAQLYGVFGTLALGMRILAEEGVTLDRMFAHGGLFRTAGVAQRMLAAVLDAPVSVTATASEGGAWGIAVLAAYLRERTASDGAPTVESAAAALDDYLQSRIFAASAVETVEPLADDVAGFATYLERYSAGLSIERAAVSALRPQTAAVGVTG